MKRFTETEKWRDPWFRKLSPDAKLAFLFMLDNADNAGVWQPDYDMAEFQIGKPMAWPLVLEEIGQRVRLLASGKLLIVGFISYQFGTLRSECKPHQQVLRLISQHGIASLLKEYSKGTQAPQDQDKDKDKDQDQEKDQDKESQFAQIWAAYPKKSGKQDARPQVFAAIKSKGFAELLEAVQAYAAAVAEWPEADRCYVPDPVRWFKRGHFDDDRATWKRKTFSKLPEML
jgi:hypothetical protein